MTAVEVDACREILRDHFGGVVAAVGHALMSERTSFPALVFRLKSTHRVSQLKRSVVILEQHNIVKFALEEHRVMYWVDPVDVFRLASSSRCALVVKTLFGEVAEGLSEEFVARGRLTCSDALRRVSQKLSVSVNEVKEKFALLTETQLLIRCAKVENTLFGCPIFENLQDSFMMPELVLAPSGDHSIPMSSGGESDEPSAKKRKLGSKVTEGRDADADVFWRVNYERFERYFRDEGVLNVAVADESSPSFRNSVRALLKVCELKVDSAASTSPPISIYEVLRYVTSNAMNVDKRTLERALDALSDSNGVIRKVGESGGGMYVVDFERAIWLQCQRMIESVIREKIDARALRIFRLLLQKGHLEEEQIEQQAMFSAKDAKELCYIMLEEHFIFIRHVPRTADFAPARTVCLFNADMVSTAENIYMNMCQALRNAIIRRCSEAKSHEVLTTRQLKMETIMMNIDADENLDDETKAQQMSEVEEMYLTDADRGKLEDFRRGQVAFLSTEVELEKDILMLRIFIEFSRRRL